MNVVLTGIAFCCGASSGTLSTFTMPPSPFGRKAPGGLEGTGGWIGLGLGAIGWMIHLSKLRLKELEFESLAAEVKPATRGPASAMSRNPPSRPGAAGPMTAGARRREQQPGLDLLPTGSQAPPVPGDCRTLVRRAQPLPETVEEFVAHGCVCLVSRAGNCRWSSSMRSEKAGCRRKQSRSVLFCSAAGSAKPAAAASWSVVKA